MENILNSIITALENDVAFRAEITAVRAFLTSDVNTAIYNFIPLTSDKVKAQARFELTAICSTFNNALAAIEAAKAVLITKGDNVFNDDITEINQNGGSILYNAATETFHHKAIFIIIYKERG